MPVLEFDITPGKAAVSGSKQGTQHLRLELYNPLAGEVFEAKFPKGRIEVDNDGSITYFSSSTDKVNVSIFLGYNVQVTIEKDGRVQVRTPSKMTSITQDIRSAKKKRAEEVTFDEIGFRLE